MAERKKTNAPSSIRAFLRNGYSSNRTVYFIGIGGSSMYTLAVLSMRMGFRVLGSDRSANYRTRSLMDMGITVYIGHDPSHIDGADLVIYTGAISEKNPEYLKSLALGIPTLPRAEYLGLLMKDYKNRIGVSGTHGKSTTVAMLDMIFHEASAEPTTLSGAELSGGDLLRIGKGELLIYEACEYKDSFLSFTPSIAIALNLELDHTDYFPDISALQSSFSSAMSNASSFSLINYDDPNLRQIISDIKSPVITFGQSERSDYRYSINNFGDTFTEFTVFRHGVTAGVFKINVPGVHNVTNAAAAISVALEYGIDKDRIAAAMNDFRSIPRRMELVGSRRGREVYYDYAHHPTEIKATISALRLVTGTPITVVFKPHTYSRTASLWDGFLSALSMADHVVMTDIFPAREEPIAQITSRRMSDNLGEKAMFSPDGEVSSYVDSFTCGAIVVMGAGDMEEIKNSLISEP
ncbi:MAG: UDP-N-acetylmuramate--L-alanine ligase [Clostridia bacterium]|nr:UDP-N-acetylmuramate--L-alanine ligase [Clostridia bacterium]